MKNMQYVISALVGLLLLAGCGTKGGPKSVRQAPTTAPVAPEVTVKPPPRNAPTPRVAPTPDTAPIPQKITVPPERVAALVGDWTRHWLSGATGSTYRVSFKLESELSMTSLEEGVAVAKMDFDGMKLSWTERWTEPGGSTEEQNSARLQPDGKTFLGSSWVPSLQTGRKFRLEKQD
jgi:hypothetical protein